MRTRQILMPVLVALALSVAAVQGQLRYGFETGIEGWRTNDAPTVKAAKAVSQSASLRNTGSYSLKIDLALQGAVSNWNSGEAYVDMLNHPPFGVPVPADLYNKEVSVMVFCPTGSQGNISFPNGLQLFVKDDQFRSVYGSWSNIVVGATGAWNRVTFTIPTNAAFNPRRIRVVGVKIGSGAGSSAVYNGSIYADTVSFPSSATNFTTPANEKYGFATWSMGWQVGSYTGCLGVTNLVRIVSPPSNATAALQLDLNLRATNAARSKGNAEVDMLYNPAYGINPPLNLSGRLVRAWVYCPAGLRGVATNANAVQLIVKDSSFRAYYGSWTPVQEGYWMPVDVTPLRTAATNGYMDAGFDPGSIRLISLQVTCPPGSTAAYSGKLYLDGVTFDPIVPGISPANQQFSFEKDIEGFTSTNVQNSNLSIMSVQRTTNKVALGGYSLQLNAKLVGTNAAFRTGDCTIDMQWWPAPNVETPINLQNKEISVYLWSPVGARGTNGAPNAYQLFVKDDQWRSYYGTWTPVYEGVWQKVTVTPSTTAATNGFMSPGFDPTRIRTIGLKLGAGTNSAIVSYTGPIYMDVLAFQAATATVSDLRYTFEIGKEGWERETYPTVSAVTSVQQSASYAFVGSNSLALNFAVRTGATAKAYGAAWVDMAYYPPPIVRAPFDLTGQRVYAYVYCPTGTQGGPVTNPSQLRLYVKDDNFKAEYGAPVAIQNGEWVRVGLAPTTNPPPDWSMEAGFNPARIRVIGVDMGMVGTNAGRLYVDYVSFPATVPAMPPSQHVYGFETASQSDWWQWTTDPNGWNARAWTNTYFATNMGSGGSVALAANAVFAGTNAAYDLRKGVFIINYNPPLNLSTKDHRTFQAKLKFVPPADGLSAFDASVNVYDKITDQWYAKNFKVGCSDWNILAFDFDNAAEYNQGSPVPMNAEAIGGISIQIFANNAWTGTVYLDDVVVGGNERGTDFNTINSGFVKQEGAKFRLDGRDYFFAGGNIEYMFSVSDSTCRELLDTATNMHLQAIRTWAFHEGKEYSFQPKRGVWNEMAFEHLDRIVAMTGHRGMRLLLGLADNWGHNGGMFQYMNWVKLEHPESMNTNVSPGSIQFHDQFYTNAWARQWYRDFVTKLLNRTNSITGRRYKDDPTIIAWEIVNEPRCETDFSGRTIHNWLWTMSDFVRGIDTNHCLGGGEEGGYVSTYDQAIQIPWETFPDNFYHYGLYGTGEDYCTDWGCGRGHGVDFISDHSTLPTVVKWQGGSFTNPGPTNMEVRAGVSNLNFSTFRIYVDQKEYNIWRTNNFGYDQRVEWINDHEYDAHYVIGKPTILEEYGLHAIGWIYNGSFGQIQIKRTPAYTLQERADVFQKYFDLVEDLDINGSFFWNLGYNGMWEDPFFMCEQVGGWFWDGSTAANGVSVSTNFVRQGTNALRLAYTATAGNTKAIYSLNTNEQWVVRERGGAPTGVNRVKFYWNIYNPGSAVQVALALKGTTNWTWAESLAQTVTSGWNRVMFDLSADSWACAAGGWTHNWYLLDVKDNNGTNVLEDVRQVDLVFTGLPVGSGALYVDNITIKRDDGFVIYADDPAVPVIRGHADRMAAKCLFGNVQYGFETGTEGWFFESGGDSLGATNTVALQGSKSLQVNMTRSAWQSVEVATDVYNQPIDLKNQALQIRVYCPTGARGSTSDPNHVYLKVKDANWKNYWIAAADITENQWLTFTITPSTSTPPGGYMEAGFDPEIIRRIYLVFACQSTGYTGPIYIDAVSYTPNQRPNNAPAVEAGTNQTVTWPARAQLDATVADDGEPKGHSLAYYWSFVSGPGAVTFTNANTCDTAAEFATPGTYVLRLAADDSQRIGYDEVTVTVNSNGTPEQVQYNFETGNDGWGPGARSADGWYSGTNSLKVDVSGSGADTTVYPASLLNLQNQPVRVRIYCPAGARGSVSNPNRVMIYLKDSAWANEWTTSWPAVEGQWLTCTIWPSTTTPLGGYKDGTFNPAAIRQIGVKFLNASSPYVGPIYVDYVTFSPNP